MALIPIEEERLIYRNMDDTSIRGKLAIANNPKTREQDTFWGGNPFHYSRLGFTKRGGYASYEMVIGRCTGRRGEGVTEVRLFNPVWQSNGQPNYYFNVYDELTVFMDDTTARLKPRSVFKDFYSRDLLSYAIGWSADMFPHVDNDYKTVCYDPNFEDAPGHWDRTDAYFGNTNWYNDYVKYFMPSFLNSPSLDYYYKYKGKDFNPRNTTDRFVKAGNGLEVQYQSTKNKIIPSFQVRWNGFTPDIEDIGICWSATETEPTKADNVITRTYRTNPDQYFVYDRTYASDSLVNQHILTNLIPDTPYYIRAWVTGLDGQPYYSEVTTARTQVNAEVPDFVMSIPYNNITNTSVDITARINNTIDSIPTRHGIKIGTSLDDMYDLTLESDNLYWVPSMSHYWMKAKVNGLRSNQKYFIIAYIEYEGELIETDSYWTEVLSEDKKWLQLQEVNENFIYTKAEAGKVQVVEALPYDITETKVTLKGKVVNNGGSEVTEYGFVWSDTNKKPTINDNIKTFYGENFEYYTWNIEGLKAGTKYYYFAYAKNSKGVSYSGTYSGIAPSFTTNGSVSILTNNVSAITKSTALVSSTLKIISNLNITEKGICWSLNPNPTIDNSRKPSIENVSTYSVGLENLESDKKYYVRAYIIASNSDIPAYYGNEISFTTGSDSNRQLPSVSTLPISSLTHKNIGVAYNIINQGSSPITSVGIGISSSNIINSINDFDNIYNGNNNSTIDINIDNLIVSQTYYIAAFAENNEGIDIGNIISFIVPEDEIINEPDFILSQNITYLNDLEIVITGNNTTGTLKNFAAYISTSNNISNAKKFTSLTNKVTVNWTIEGIIYIWAEAKLGDTVYLSEYKTIEISNSIIINSDGLFKLPINPNINDTYIFNNKIWVYSDEGWIKDNSIRNVYNNDSVSAINNVNDIVSYDSIEQLKIINTKKIIAKDKFIYSDHEHINYYMQLWLGEKSPFIENERVNIKFGETLLENLYQTINQEDDNIITIHFPGIEINNQMITQSEIAGILENTTFSIEVSSYDIQNKQILTPVNNNIKFRIEDIEGLSTFEEANY